MQRPGLGFWHGQGSAAAASVAGEAPAVAAVAATGDASAPADVAPDL